MPPRRARPKRGRRRRAPKQKADRGVRAASPGLPDERLIRAVNAALRRQHGAPPPQERGDALDGLIGTILSQNTTSANSRAAFTELKRRFPSWAQCLAAPEASVIDAIRSAGLAEIRGPRIRQILRRVLEDQGTLSLEVVRTLAPRQAMAYLQSFPGVGPKTAACVLLFSCRRQVFPVDTHVARIARRLRWVPEAAAPDKIQELLEPIIPAGLRYALHVNLIAHGRAVCHPRSPECEACVIRKYCATGMKRAG